MTRSPRSSSYPGCIQIVFTLVLLLSCNKQYAPAPDPLNGAIINLTGNNGSFSKWALQSLYINNSPQPVISRNNTYYKSYMLNGTYEDADGLRGKWSMISKDSLREIITNTTNGTYATQNYRILSLTDKNLSLFYTVPSGNVQLNFMATK